MKRRSIFTSALILVLLVSGQVVDALTYPNVDAWGTIDHGTGGNSNVHVVQAPICEAPLGQRCYYVSTSGNDAYEGSFEYPFETIQHAINTMDGGDVIYLREGTYYERDIYISNTKSGTPESWSVLKSYPGEWAIIDGQRSCEYPNARSVIYNGGFAHEGTPDDANYWKFEYLEITGGGTAGLSDVTAGGIWWNGGPVQVRYCYIHDNLADDQNENPAGFNGNSQHDVLIEYCYFENNGSVDHEHNNSRNVCFTGSTEYSSTPFDENWYVRNNEIRYNLIDANGGGGIQTKSYQWLTPVRDGSDMSHRTWGDRIHHNIVLNAKYGGVFWQQDYSQIYENIVVMHPDAGEGDWGIATRRIRTDGVDTLHNVVYNNLLVDSTAAAIFDGYEGQDSTPAYWWVYNNIVDNHRDDWDRVDVSFGTRADDGPFNTDNLHIDRNYFYRCDNQDVVKIRHTSYTVNTFEAAFPGTDLWQNAYDDADPLYEGTVGAGRYKPRAGHVLDGAVTIADGGIGGPHPYLEGVTIPSYVGPCAADDCAWIDQVLDLRNLGPEVAAGLTLHGTPGNRVIHLAWTVTGTLPATSTWRIGYESESGTAAFPAATIPTATVRAWTLTGLTNYVWYTVTLDAMLGGAPWLTDTVRVMPTDRFVYLPLVLRSMP